MLVGRSFGGLIAPRGASGEHRLAAMIVDPGQLEMGSAVMNRLGDLGQHLDDPAADARSEALLTIPALLLVTWLRSNDTGRWVLKRPAWAGSYRENGSLCERSKKSR